VRHSRTVRAVALVVLGLLAACNGLTVDQKGVYTSAPTQEITGTFTVGDGDTLTSVTVNGEPATISGDTYRHELPLDGGAIVNHVNVEATFGSGEVIRERRTVVYGDGQTARVVPAGEPIGNGVGLRVNERSFSKLGPVITSLTTIDTAAIAPAGTVLLDECITKIIVCTLSARATTASPPTIGSYDVALDSGQGSVGAVVTLHDLHVPVDVDARIVGIPASCDLSVDAGSVTIDGDYALAPGVPDPHVLDVNLVQPTPTVATADVTSDFTSGVCSVAVIEQIVGALLPDVETLLRTNLTRLLGDPDAAGALDSPVADAIEAALAQVNIAGPIGDSLGLTLDSTLTAADEDPDGVGLRADALFSSAGVAPEAPDLTGSVAMGDVLGPIGSTTPDGRPFDVAVGASVAGFDQLLAGETERGLLNVDVTSLDGQPLTLKTLLDTIGAGGLVTDDRPLVISLRPEIAPFVTTAEPPAGALAEMLFHGYRVTVKTADATNAVLMQLVIDFSTGVDLAVDDEGLAFSFDTPAAENFSSDITSNPLGLPADVIDQVFQTLSPRVFAAVAEVLPRFPLPRFVGLDLAPVQIARASSGFVLFADLVPAA
jgi:hypothetical protein